MLKRSYLWLMSFIVIVSLVLAGCNGSPKPGTTTDPTGSNRSAPPVSSLASSGQPRGITGTITTGTMVEASSIPVSPNGGSFTLNKTDNPLNGLVLGVPPNSYKENRQFKISYAPIEKHSFGEAFNPLTPLIRIDNGGGYADGIMEVTIPVKVPADSFAMGFIYDDKTKKLMGLPTLAQTENSITIGTRHFTDLIISMIPLVNLKKDIDSGFRPGIDDWQFTNYGSYVAKGGHCAGQSVTALWYYVNQPDGKDLTLYGRYDNNSTKPATPDLWQDDSLGYRFASTVHHDINWNSFENNFWTDLAGVNDENTWKLFAYSMQLTGEPQEVGIFSKAGGGHDMICYRVKDGTLYIADPNYPGNTERRIEYVNGKFKPYNSGANADEIAKGNGKAYETIEYCAKTTTVSWDKIAQRWQEMKNGTIGNGVFPAYQIVWTDEKKIDHELKDGYVSPDKLININTVVNNIQANETNTVSVYRDGKPLNWDAKGNCELLPGENKLGVYVMVDVPGTDKNGNPIKISKYVDFKYLTVICNEVVVGVVLDPKEGSGEAGKPLTFTAKMAKPPAGSRYDWHIAGDVKQSGPSASFTYTYQNPGFYAIWVEVFDDKGKKLAETNGRAVIGAAAATATTKPASDVWVLKNTTTSTVFSPSGAAPQPAIKVTAAAGTANISYAGPSLRASDNNIAYNWQFNWTSPPASFKAGDVVKGTAGMQTTVNLTGTPHDPYMYSDARAGITFNAGSPQVGGAGLIVQSQVSSKNSLTFSTQDGGYQFNGNVATFTVTCTVDKMGVNLAGPSSVTAVVTYTYEKAP